MQSSSLTMRLALCFLAAGVVLPLRSCPAAGATSEQVDAAVAKGRAYLLARQKDGNWEVAPAPPPGAAHGGSSPTDAEWGGLSSLAVNALLAAGENPRSPAMKQAVDFLLQANIRGVYSLGMRCQVWKQLRPTPEFKAAAQKDARSLLLAVKAVGEARGMYYYPSGFPDAYDHSISQFGVLGMWACERLGVEVPEQYWAEMDRAWRAHQYPDGSWSYIFKGPGDTADSTPQMTEAGIATLFISQNYLHLTDGSGCRGNTRDPNIDRGLQWMADHFNLLLQPTRGSTNYYAFYGLERVGVASGRKNFGVIDWYRTLSDVLVKFQNPDGSWGFGGDLFGQNFANVPDTSFALLFLARGGAPVMMNKLQYSLQSNGKAVEANWNQRPRDAANLAQWTGEQQERDLNWQVVNLQVPPEDLHDSPILYLAGNQALDFTDAEEQKLRAFVEQGGMILGNADCAAPAFADSFQALGRKLFPRGEFALLPVGHPVFTHQQFLADKWKGKPEVLALSNGVRLLMALMPSGDPARAWQVQGRMRVDAFELAADLFLYATDLQPWSKNGGYMVAMDPAVTAGRSLRVARLAYDGNWDPEPGGWRRLAAVTHNQCKTDLVAETVTLGEGKLASSDGKLGGYKIAHLTGTAGFKLIEAQTAEMKRFVSGGGTLVVDAAGGSTTFAESAERMLTDLFGADAEQIEAELPAGHGVYTLPGRPPVSVHLRNFARKRAGLGMVRPHLRGIDIGGRTAVFYSREDLSGGLVGEPMDGIVGYDPESATALMTDILLYASR